MKADFFDQSFFVTGWEIVCKKWERNYFSLHN